MRSALAVTIIRSRHTKFSRVAARLDGLGRFLSRATRHWARSCCGPARRGRPRRQQCRVEIAQLRPHRRDDCARAQRPVRRVRRASSGGQQLGGAAPNRRIFQQKQLPDQAKPLAKAMPPCGCRHRCANGRVYTEVEARGARPPNIRSNTGLQRVASKFLISPAVNWEPHALIPMK